jgi:hypothetical protein
MFGTAGSMFDRSAHVVAALAITVSSAAAQSTSAAGTPHRHDSSPTAKAGSHARHDVEAGADPTSAVHEAMNGTMAANPHMRMSPRRTATAADSARAETIVATARAALARYKDVRVAEREGYRMFAPNVKNQPVYHFTKMAAAVRERFKFDPAQPSSLLYKKTADGSLRLVGAMYTASKDASWDDLNARIPLGIASWHLHTNMCVPKFSQRARWLEVSNGKPVFGPASPIATPDACDTVNGRFMPVVFNWMVHANVFEADVWGDHH